MVTGAFLVIYLEIIVFLAHRTFHGLYKMGMKCIIISGRFFSIMVSEHSGFSVPLTPPLPLTA